LNLEKQRREGREAGIGRTTTTTSTAEDEQLATSAIHAFGFDLVSIFGVHLLMEIQSPPCDQDPDAARREMADRVAVTSGGDREALQQLRSRFSRRLYRVSDDYRASAGLRVTEAALALVARLEGGGGSVESGPAKRRGRMWRWGRNRRG
jgi:hypothetical protein